MGHPRTIAGKRADEKSSEAAGPETGVLLRTCTNVLMVFASIVVIIVKWRVLSWKNVGFRSLSSVFATTT